MDTINPFTSTYLVAPITAAKVALADAHAAIEHGAQSQYATKTAAKARASAIAAAAAATYARTFITDLKRLDGGIDQILLLRNKMIEGTVSILGQHESMLREAAECLEGST
jgi:ribonuclease PH